MLTGEAKILLEQTAVAIETEYKRVDMQHWVRVQLAGCGLVCCIGGWIMTLALQELDDKTRFKLLPLMDIKEEATRLLGLTPDQASRLFFVSKWPPQFRSDSPRPNLSGTGPDWRLHGDPLPGTPEYAAGVAARIRFFSATDGTDQPDQVDVDLVDAEYAAELEYAGI